MIGGRAEIGEGICECMKCGRLRMGASKPAMLGGWGGLAGGLVRGEGVAGVQGEGLEDCEDEAGNGGEDCCHGWRRGWAFRNGSILRWSSGKGVADRVGI